MPARAADVIRAVPNGAAFPWRALAAHGVLVARRARRDLGARADVGSRRVLSMLRPMAETAVPTPAVHRRAVLDDPPPDVIVVGAGLAGLTAGCLLARAGHRVEIHERHTAPGGYATTFTRRARDGTQYVFDVSLHSIGGLAPDGLVRKNLERCGVWDDLDPIRLPHQYRWI